MILLKSCLYTLDLPTPTYGPADVGGGGVGRGVEERVSCSEHSTVYTMLAATAFAVVCFILICPPLPACGMGAADVDRRTSPEGHPKL